MSQIPSYKTNHTERRLGAAVGLANVFVNLGSKLLIIHIILGYLDNDEFGLYQVMGAFVGHLALIDLGISGTLGRFIAKYQAIKNKVGQDNVFSMCIIIYAGLAVIISLIGLVLYHYLDDVFSRTLSPLQMSDAKVMFVILLASIFATILGRAFVGVNTGHERFVFTRLAECVCILAKVGAVAAVLAMGHRAIGIVVAEALINIAILLLNSVYAITILKVRFKLNFWDWELFAEIRGFAFWTFLAALVLQINFRYGTVLLGAMCTTTIAGVYAIALQINTLYNMLPTAISSVFLPKITRLVVQETDGEELTKIIIGPSRYQFMLMGCVLGGFILFGKQFINIWAGGDYSEAWATALAILVPVTIPLCQNTILCVLQAKMLNRDRALITIGIAIINGLSAILMVKFFGLYGPAISTGIALLIGHGLIMNVYYHYYVKLNMRLFAKKVTERILTVIVVTTILGSATNYLLVPNNWIGLGIRSSLYFLLYSIAMWCYGMNPNERMLFRSLAFQKTKCRYI